MLRSMAPTGRFEVDLDDGRTLEGESKLKDIVTWERSHKGDFVTGESVSFSKLLWVVFAALKRTGQIPEYNTANDFIDHVDDLRQELPGDDDEGEDADGGVVLPNPTEADISA